MRCTTLRHATSPLPLAPIERSFCAYNAMLDTKRISLATHSIMAFHFLNWNLRIKSALKEERSLERETGKAEEKPKKRPALDVIKVVKDKKEMNVETEERQTKLCNRRPARLQSRSKEEYVN